MAKKKTTKSSSSNSSKKVKISLSAGFDKNPLKMASVKINKGKNA